MKLCLRPANPIDKKHSCDRMLHRKMDMAETVESRIQRLRYEAYHSAVAQTSHGSVLLQRGAFSTEDDFDRELGELLNKWETGNCYEF